MTVSKKQLASLIDHTNLDPGATEKDLRKLANEAEEYGFASVCCYSSDAEIIRRYANSVDLCCVVGFPHGKSTTQSKVREAVDAMNHGASEIDTVINQGKVLDGKFKEVIEDISEVVKEVHKREGTVKVICENCNLPTREVKGKAYKACDRAGADFVKTSTGFGEYGARVEDVRFMREVLDEIGSDMGIKAAGGIHYATRNAAEEDGKDEDGALEFLEAAGGQADPSKFRIGASSGVQIVETYNI